MLKLRRAGRRTNRLRHLQSLRPNLSALRISQALQSAKGEKPLLIYVGFRIPYAEAHIPGSEYFGPAAKPAMVQQLRKHVEGLPRNKFIVIYCGCCPWSHCPNVKPAYEALHNLGFTKLKVLYIADNLGTDWVNKGYPIERVNSDSPACRV